MTRSIAQRKLYPWIVAEILVSCLLVGFATNVSDAALRAALVVPLAVIAAILLVILIRIYVSLRRNEVKEVSDTKP